MSIKAEAQKTRESQVRNQLTDLDKYLAMMREQLTELEGLLAPVLRDTEPQVRGDEGNSDGAHLVPLADVLRSKNCMLDDLVNTIKDIRHRLEV